MIYSYALWGVILCGCLSRRVLEKNSPQRKFYVCLVSALMILFMGFRGDIFTDYSLMINIYHYVARINIADLFTMDFHLNIEGIAFALLMRFSYDVFGAATGIIAFMVISAILVIVPLSVIIYKYSESPALSYMIYVALGTYYEGFNITQQMISASIGFIAIVLWISGRKKLATVIAVIAVGFHISAIIVLGYFLVSKIKNQTLQVVFTIVGLAASFGATKIAGIFGRLVYHKNYALNSSYDLSSVGIPLLIIAFFVILYFVSWRLYFEKKEDLLWNNDTVLLEGKQGIWYWANGSIAWMVFLIFKLFVALATRFASFFMPFTMIFIPGVLRVNIFNRRSRIIITVLFILFLTYYYLRISSRIIWSYVSIFG